MNDSQKALLRKARGDILTAIDALDKVLNDPGVEELKKRERGSLQRAVWDLEKSLAEIKTTYAAADVVDDD